MKINTILYLFLLLLMVTTCANQDDKTNTLKIKIKKNAELMANSLVSKDYMNFIKYMHPTLLKMMGGKDAMIETLNGGLPGGNEIKKVTISIPSKLIIEKNIIQCTLSGEIEMSVKEGRLIFKSNLIALSYDNGKNWYFIDTSNFTLQQLKEFIPELSNKVQLKKWEKPIFISN